MIFLDKNFVNEANKIIFDFIWKGKDKIKRLALISDTEDGGLKASHLDSIITELKPREFFVPNDSQMSNPAVGKLYFYTT